MDILLRDGQSFLGIELKRNEASSVPSSMRNALETLHLRELWVVYPGEDSFALTERIVCHSLSGALARLSALS